MKARTVRLVGLPLICAALCFVNASNDWRITTYTVKKGDALSEMYRKYPSNLPFSCFKKLNKHLSEENGSYSRLDAGDGVGESDKDFDDLEKVVDSNIWGFISRVHDNPANIGINLPSLSVIASSNVAEGLANYSIKERKHHDTIVKALDNIVQTNMSAKFNPYGTNLSGVTNFGDHGLFLSHMNIILGEYERVAQDGKYKALNTGISKHLAARSLSDARKHMPSYAGKPQRWPADQAALLFSLYLYDQNFGTNISEQPIREWLDYMRNHGTDPKTGLYRSEITGGTPYSRFPRGCGLSWILKYMARFAPEEAEQLWEKYKDEFLVDYGFFAGFREYPAGSGLRPDGDSGPVINGIGASATAFGIGAANAIGNDFTYLKLGNLYALFEVGVWIGGDPNTKKRAGDLLSSSIIFSGRNQ